MGASQSARRALAAILVVVSLAACGQSTKTSIELVAAPVAAQIIDERAPHLVLLDVRTAEEFAAGRVAGSLNLDVTSAEFAARLDQLDKETPYMVYCQSGNRSARAITVMRDLGFTDVWEIDGGIVAWQNAGLPTEP